MKSNIIFQGARVSSELRPPHFR